MKGSAGTDTECGGGARFDMSAPGQVSLPRALLRERAAMAVLHGPACSVTPSVDVAPLINLDLLSARLLSFPPVASALRRGDTWSTVM